MRPKVLLLFCFVILFLTSCTVQPVQVQPTETGLSGKISFAGSTTVQPLAAKLGEAFQKQNPSVSLDIAAGGSKVGIQAVHDGTADIGMSSRNLSAEELVGVKIYTIALDALAIIVHPTNPVQNLTRQQLQDIYLGTITNWKEVGGPDLKITVVIRDQNSGSRGAFDEIVLDKKEPTAPLLKSAITAGDVTAMIASEPGGIGYVGFGNLDQSVRLIQIDSVTPSSDTVLSGDYILQRPLLLMTGSLSQPLADSFIHFALSKEGQEIISAEGWTPIMK